MTAWQELATIRHKNLSQDIERLQWNQDTASEYSDDEDPKEGLTKSALEAHLSQCDQRGSSQSMWSARLISVNVISKAHLSQCGQQGPSLGEQAGYLGKGKATGWKINDCGERWN